MKKQMSINGRSIGMGQRPYVIAELSGNHNGEIERAFALMEEAKQAGVDAIKIQTYTADTITIDHDGEDFLIKGGLWDGNTLYSLYEKAHTPWEWHAALFEKARELDITIFSTPFDETAVDFLEELGAPAYKIASFEATDHALIEKAASTGKPLIISTGMANLEEIGESLAVAREAGCEQVALLHCISGYPTPIEDVNLRTMQDIAERFDVISGLSDHTLGNAVSVAAVVLGAAVIEKHVTLRRADGGPDAAFSLEPEELQALCRDCHTAWAALGKVDYTRKPSEEGSAIFRRSLYVVQDLAAGETFSRENVRSIRPGYGLPPKYLKSILGKRASKDIKRGTALDWPLIED